MYTKSKASSARRQIVRSIIRKFLSLSLAVAIAAAPKEDTIRVSTMEMKQ